VRLSEGRRQVVHVTIAGADDIPIDVNSDLYHNLVAALRRYGEPHQPLVVQVRELLRLVLEARVYVLPDYEWPTVEPQVRAALLDTFGFARRELGQDALLSEVISVIQQVKGVAYVDVDRFGGVPEKRPDGENPDQRRFLTPDEIAAAIENLPLDTTLTRVAANLGDREDGGLRPAQIAYFTPAVPATLILNGA
jgi:hypothetical protein